MNLQIKLALEKKLQKIGKLFKITHLSKVREEAYPFFSPFYLTSEPSNIILDAENRLTQYTEFQIWIRKFLHEKKKISKLRRE